MGLKDLKPNTIQVLLEQYVHTLLGVRKVGKTTLFRDLVYEKYNGDMSKGLLIPFEKGYQALDGIYTTDDFKPINVWADYEEIVKELISDRQELPYRLLGIDTIDVMVDMAEKESIRFYNLKVEPSKRAKTINEAGGGYGRGKAYAKQLIRESINKLMKSGYGIVFIGHSREKSVKEKDGMEYNQLSCSLTNDYADIFLDMADLITFLTVEKEIENTQVVSKKVFMNFRSDGYIIDCGGRFKGLPEKVEYGARNYLSVFENAVKASMLKPVDNLKDIEAEQFKKFEDNAKQNIETMVELPQTVKEIKKLMKEKYSAKVIDNNFIMKMFDEHGIAKPDEIDDINVAKKILETLQQV